MKSNITENCAKKVIGHKIHSRKFSECLIIVAQLVIMHKSLVLGISFQLEKCL